MEIQAANCSGGRDYQMVHVRERPHLVVAPVTTNQGATAGRYEAAALCVEWAGGALFSECHLVSGIGGVSRGKFAL